MNDELAAGTGPRFGEPSRAAGPRVGGTARDTSRSAMMLAVDHATQAREVAFYLIGIRAVLRVSLTVIDAASRPAIVQRIPV